MKIAFVGNPNCGKTTLFNAYTGARLKVANFPGVTVERVDGEIVFDNKKILLTDLPGIYSLSSYTMEEIISRKYIEEKNADVIINVVDASLPERNLYLTLQLISLKVPVVIALNMMDIVEKRGMDIDIKKLQKLLYNTPVIPVSARKRNGLDVLIKKAAEENIINSYDKRSRDIDVRTDYDYIEFIIKECVGGYTGRSRISDNADKIFIHNIFSLPIFFFIMMLVFFMTFHVGDFLKIYMQKIINWFSMSVYKAMVLNHINRWLIMLVTDGIITGVGSVLTFLPNIIVLFGCLAILEDSGYMPRAAYIMNDIMKKSGLSGNSFIMLLLGFGCSVPAVMATRALKNSEEKRKVISLIPFMSCAAKLPVYVLLADVFFTKYRLYAVYSLYVFGIAAAIISSRISGAFRKTPGSVLLIELPEYRMPDFYTIFIYVWEKVKDYIIKAGTIIFASSVVIWVLMNTGPSGAVTDPDLSFAANIGRFFVPVLRPAGLGFWQAPAVLIAGLSAKEAIVSGLSLLYNITDINSAQGKIILEKSLSLHGFNSAGAYAFMVFALLYPPCAAALITIKNETGSWLWTAKFVMSRLVSAWACAVFVYMVLH